MPGECETLLRAARAMARTVAETFGHDCEVVVHDLRIPTRSVVHIENGHVTGRSVGAPIGDLILRVLPSLPQQEDMLSNYLTILQDGRRLKSTTCLIRDGQDDPLIAICINLDLTALEGEENAVQNLALVDDDSGGESKMLYNNADEARVSDILSFLVANVMRSFGDPSNLPKSQRLQAMEFLDKKGAFLIKGSVPMVARSLGVSEPTVYRYLDELRRLEHEKKTVDEDTARLKLEASIDPVHSSYSSRSNSVAASQSTRHS